MKELIELALLGCCVFGFLALVPLGILGAWGVIPIQVFGVWLVMCLFGFPALLNLTFNK